MKNESNDDDDQLAPNQLPPFLESDNDGKVVVPKTFNTMREFQSAMVEFAAKHDFRYVCPGICPSSPSTPMNLFLFQCALCIGARNSESEIPPPVHCVHIEAFHSRKDGTGFSANVVHFQPTHGCIENEYKARNAKLMRMFDAMEEAARKLIEASRHTEKM